MAYYNPYLAYQPAPPQQVMQPMMQQQVPQTAPPSQGGFIRVQSENEARMYPVAPGNSVTFLDENAPYCYTKTVDFSQLDRPKFEKYRMVKEEDAPAAAATPAPDYATRKDLEALRGEVEALKVRLEDAVHE